MRHIKSSKRGKKWGERQKWQMKCPARCTGNNLEEKAKTANDEEAQKQIFNHFDGCRRPILYEDTNVYDDKVIKMYVWTIAWWSQQKQTKNKEKNQEKKCPFCQTICATFFASSKFIPIVKHHKSHAGDWVWREQMAACVIRFDMCSMSITGLFSHFIGHQLDIAEIVNMRATVCVCSGLIWEWSMPIRRWRFCHHCKHQRASRAQRQSAESYRLQAVWLKWSPFAVCAARLFHRLRARTSSQGGHNRLSSRCI